MQFLKLKPYSLNFSDFRFVHCISVGTPMGLGNWSGVESSMLDIVGCLVEINTCGYALENNLFCFLKTLNASILSLNK